MSVYTNVLPSPRKFRIKRVNPTGFSDKLNSLRSLNLFNEFNTFSTKRYSPKDYFDVFLSAGLHQTSIKSMAHHLRNKEFFAPSSEQIMLRCRHISKEKATTLTNVMLGNFYKALPAKFRRQLSKSGVLIIDFHQDPYYGDPSNPDIIKSKTKKSTNYFYEYLTAQAYSKFGSQTIAVIPRVRGKPIVSHIQELFSHVQKIFRPKLLLMDGEFTNFDIITYLNSLEIPFIARKSRTVSVKSAINRICLDSNWNKNKKWHRILTRKGGSRKHYLPLDIIPTKVYGQIKVLCKSPNLNISPGKAEHIYGWRFNIETGYRDQHLVQPRIKSKVFSTRILVFVIAIFLWNVWQYARWAMNWSKNAYKKWSTNKKIAWSLLILKITIITEGIWT
ncbi:MAG: hypothetical protein ACTSPA_12240 [Promethearchaeota archaeon]